MKLKYLVTGTGRCGTVYMARFLTKLNIFCGHEAIFDHNGIEMARKRLSGEEKIQTSTCSVYNHVSKETNENWFKPNIVAESSYMSAPYLNDPILDGVKIIHLIRHPLKVLSSWVNDIHFFEEGQTEGEQFRKLICEHLPQIEKEPTEIEKACRYLIEWTKLIEQNSKNRMVVKIEDYPFTDLVNFIRKDANMDNGILDNNKVNSWKINPDLTLEDIPNGKTKDEFKTLMYKQKYEKIQKVLI